MFEDERPGLFAMTFGAALVETRHRQSASGFENVQPVRIVALHAIQATFDDGVMLGQIELGMSFEMALEAGGLLLLVGVAWFGSGSIDGSLGKGASISSLAQYPKKTD